MNLNHVIDNKHKLGPRDSREIILDVHQIYWHCTGYYVLFSASTQRWIICRKYVKKSRVASFKSMRYQAAQFYDTLFEVFETIKGEPAFLCKEFKNFKFNVSIAF